jgi:hypothetical protein
VSDRDELTQKALRAARAVTMSAALLGGGAACGDEPPDEPSDSWSFTDEDTATDTGTDTTEPPDTVADTTEPDTSQPVCSSTSDNVCPAECSQSNDRDCCEQQTNCQWFDDSCGCAVPGPFTPPAMLA